MQDMKSSSKISMKLMVSFLILKAEDSMIDKIAIFSEIMSIELTVGLKIKLKNSRSKRKIYLTKKRLWRS